MLIYYEASDLSREITPNDSLAYGGSRGWNSPPDCTVRDGGGLMERVAYILEAMKEEEWLPASLRALILDGVLKLRQTERYGSLTLEKAREIIGNMAIGCYVYNELTMRSKTLRHVRVLDMELTGFQAVGVSRS